MPDNPAENLADDVNADVTVAPECLHLDPETRKDAVLRLKSAKGHLEGIVRMLDDPEVYCVDVMKQLSARTGRTDQSQRQGAARTYQRPCGHRRTTRRHRAHRR